MAYDKRFDSLDCFAGDILKEVIREGEVRLDAQLQAATASDQRAMAWAGFLITVALASAGAAFSLALGDKHSILAGIAFGFSVTVVAAAIYAMNSARPAEFCFPGNAPENWLPDNWDVAPASESDWCQARKEQASALNNRIRENTRWAKAAGRKLSRSMDLLIWAIPFWGFLAIFAVAFS